ncbi:DNA-dependent metalloprotease WSS1 [Cercospora beticola]|uniref:DNA-dependent metalloprotease WSS1 n=1 Tax=Cercospora beticola TaxID=122368 RepID=A0A2G5HKH9_CERBT|nr:DNA-dependent metalloprotease WSS1 [Cercospora beticola]PIA93071.1 DNA-dependent metalloprotease WSS1 [Cercospora beticola]WPB01331.1 hypothetical protein RHO25_005955 [Cercospora beticola]CAK1363897.1 unnamed protein product [Cercospora beticola]
MSSWRPPGPPGNHRPAFPGNNRTPSEGGPSGVHRSSPIQFKETESLFNTYEHLSGLPRSDDALLLLRKIASVVKPIMRKRGWKVSVLAEFLPPEPNLLGLNINKGYKICVRLRYHNNPDLFLPFEECVDTMLHELSHNVWGPHDSNFHKLWDELRDEHEVLVRKGYTGEGFLGSGNRLGGAYAGRPQLPAHELRRLARASAEKRKKQGTLSNGSGQRLGGTPIHRGQDVRSVIVDQITKRNNAMSEVSCASGRQDAGKLSQESSDKTFKTKAEEDDANNRAIAQALFELMEQEEEQKLFSEGGLKWSKEAGLYSANEAGSSSSATTSSHPSEEDQLKWALAESTGVSPAQPTALTQWTCEICTCINPLQFLACDACGVERPQTALVKEKSKSRKPSNPSPGVTRKPVRSSRDLNVKPLPTKTAAERFPTKQPNPNASIGWQCSRCGTFMEHQWWTCSACGLLKDSS